MLLSYEQHTEIDTEAGGSKGSRASTPGTNEDYKELKKLKYQFVQPENFESKERFTLTHGKQLAHISMSKITSCVLMLMVVCGKVEAQKGEKTLAAGFLAAISDNNKATGYSGYEYSWGTGIGIDVTGQSNITDKSAILLQLEITHFRGSSRYTSLLHDPTVTPVSLKVGYRYQLSSSGFYANALIGPEWADGDKYLPFALGIGKRIAVKDKYFIDAGIDLTGGFVTRLNIKAIFSVLQTAKN